VDAGADHSGRKRGICAVTTTLLYIVVAILANDQEKIPPRIEALVRAYTKSRIAFSGTFLAENIGIEKALFDIVANSNIHPRPCMAPNLLGAPLIHFKREKSYFPTTEKSSPRRRWRGQSRRWLAVRCAP